MNELTDDDSGSYRVMTSSGSAYLIDMDARQIQRFRVESQPTEKYVDIRKSELRLDAEVIPLLRIHQLKVGERGVMCLDVVGDGRTMTFRDTTELISIERLVNQPA